MKVVVGLGNPGKEYEFTRHNVGFMVVEELARAEGEEKWKTEKKFKAEVWRKGELVLVKPTTFMNRSGECVAKIVNFYRVSLKDLWLVHDDLDIGWGEYKVSWGKGPKIHRGVDSVEAELGESDFWRVRVGVDNRSRVDREKMRGMDYVLAKLTSEERKELRQMVGLIGRDLEERLITSADMG